MVGLPSNSADPFFSDRNLGNSGPSSGSIRNFFSIFFNRLEVSQVFFQSAGHKKNGISVFSDSGWPQGPVSVTSGRFSEKSDSDLLCSGCSSRSCSLCSDKPHSSRAPPKNGFRPRFSSKRGKSAPPYLPPSGTFTLGPLFGKN
jgi:hypothetical protein